MTPGPHAPDNAERSPPVDLILLAGLGLAIGLSPLAAGYSDPRIWAPAGVVLGGALIGVVASGRDRMRPLPAVAVASIAGLGLWSLASASWAPSPYGAAVAGNLVHVYAILLALLVLLVSDRTRVACLVASVILGVTVVAAVVLGRMGFEDDPVALFTAGRLNEPLGYVNGQGSVFLLAIFPALALAEQVRSPTLAGLGAAGAALFAGLALLSGARGVLLAGLVALIAVLVLVPGRLRRAALIVAVAAPLATAAPALTDILALRTEPAELSAAIRQGAHRLVLATVLAGLAWTAIVALRARSPAQLRRTVRTVWLGALTLAAAAAVFVAVTSTGEIARGLERGYESFSGADTAESETAPESRLASGGGARYDYWRVAIDVWETDKLTGIGGGGWGGAYLTRRRTTEDAAQPHSLPLQTVAELGLIGTALLALAWGALLWVALRGAAAAHRGSRELLPLLMVGMGTSAAWMVHTSVDWMHLIPGVSAMAIAAAVALVHTEESTPTSAPRRRRPALLIGLAMLLVLSMFSLTRQALGDHYRARAEAALATRPAAAVELADRSLRFQESAVPTYYVKAAALARLGHAVPAELTLGEAVRREPANFLTYAVSGDLLIRQGRIGRARRAYGKASRLKPLDAELRSYAVDPRRALRSTP